VGNSFGLNTQVMVSLIDLGRNRVELIS